MQICDIKAHPAIVVVIQQEVLIGNDIETIVRDVWPEARVVLAKNLQAAVDNLPPGRIEVALVQVEPATIAASTLGRRVAADGGRVVVLCEEKGGRLPEGWKALPYPFASTDLATLLAGLS